MSRTVVNVTGDITVAAYVAKSEGHEIMTRDLLPTVLGEMDDGPDQS